MKKHKIDRLKEVQNYVKGKVFENNRMTFIIRCKMVKHVKGNVKDKYSRKGGEEALLCEDCSCEQIQTQSNCLVVLTGRT